MDTPKIKWGISASIIIFLTWYYISAYAVIGLVIGYSIMTVIFCKYQPDAGLNALGRWIKRNP